MMAHVLMLAETDPRNWQAFEDWINSLDYGSRPYCREIKLYDINCNEKHLNQFLGDIKHYYRGRKAGEKKFSKMYRAYVWFLKKLNKILPLNPIDMDKIEKSPKEWFTPYHKYRKNYRKTGGMKGVGNFLYLMPLGYMKDEIKSGNERI